MVEEAGEKARKQSSGVGSWVEKRERNEREKRESERESEIESEREGAVSRDSKRQRKKSRERGGSIGSLGSKGSKESSAAIRQTAQYGAFSDVKGEVSHHTPERGLHTGQILYQIPAAFSQPPQAAAGLLDRPYRTITIIPPPGKEFGSSGSVPFNNSTPLGTPSPSESKPRSRGMPFSSHCTYDILP